MIVMKYVHGFVKWAQQCSFALCVWAVMALGLSGCSTAPEEYIMRDKTALQAVKKSSYIQWEKTSFDLESVGQSLTARAGDELFYPSLEQAQTLDLQNMQLVHTHVTDAAPYAFVKSQSVYVEVGRDSVLKVFRVEDDEHTLLWEKELRGLPLLAPMIQSGSVILYASDGSLQSFQLASGELLWYVKLHVSPEAITKVIPMDGALLVANSAGVLKVLDARAGAPVWLQQVSSIGLDDLAFTRSLDSQLKLNQWAVLVNDKALVMVDVQSGKLLWERQLSDSGCGVAIGAYTIACHRGKLQAMNELGVTVWDKTLNTKAIKRLTVLGDVVLVEGMRKELFIVDMLNGQLLEKLKADLLTYKRHVNRNADKVLYINSKSEHRVLSLK